VCPVHLFRLICSRRGGLVEEGADAQAPVGDRQGHGGHEMVPRITLQDPVSKFSIHRVICMGGHGGGETSFEVK